MSDHVHELARCYDCNWDGPCIHCDGRGYYEVCWICGEPMGNKRRKWKRDQAAVRAVAEASDG